MKTFIVTGAAGFIGSFLCRRLLEDDKNIVIGIDNLNHYYDISLKKDRLKLLKNYSNFVFFKLDLENSKKLFAIFKKYKPDYVVNLAAQAGVRYSIEHPESYISSNIIGFFNILEACRKYPVKHLVFASSSSVYGDKSKIPYSTEEKTDYPESLYAATKKSDELMAYTYSSLYNIPTTGLRFFTVYGPFGRPDMAYFKFTKKILSGEKIEVYNNGKCERDFTYIDDIVEGIFRVLNKEPQESDGVKFKVYNIGHGDPVNLLGFINILFAELKSNGLIDNKYKLEEHEIFLNSQPGDVAVTFADTKDFERDFGFVPLTKFEDGIKKFITWYKDYYDK